MERVVSIRQAIEDALRATRAELVAAARGWRPCDANYAEDLVQEAVLKGLSQLENGKLSVVDGVAESIRGVLFQALIDVVRNDRRNSVREPHTIAIEEADDSYIGSMSVSRSEWRRRFWPRIEALPDKYRLPMLLHLDGYSIREISEILGLGRNQISNRLEYGQHLLGEQVPGLITDDLSIGLMMDASAVTIYRAPKEPWIPWVNNHPEDFIVELNSQGEIVGMSQGRKRRAIQGTAVSIDSDQDRTKEERCEA